MRFIPIGLACLATTACAAFPGDEPRGQLGPADVCRTEALGELVGRPATTELGAEAMRRSGVRRLRWIRPGDAVTMDYSPSRLNVHLDRDNRVESFACG